MEVPAKMSASLMVFTFVKPMLLKQEYVYTLMLHFTDKPSDNALIQIRDIELYHFQLLKRGSGTTEKISALRLLKPRI